MLTDPEAQKLNQHCFKLLSRSELRGKEFDFYAKGVFDVVRFLESAIQEKPLEGTKTKV